ARATEAGLKYFVLGALSSGMLLYGVSLLYGASGSIQYDTLQTFIASGTPGMGITLGLVFIISAFCFKISAAPFHMWTPDVYQGAATPVTAFFTTAPKVAGALVLAQILLGPLLGAATAWSQILWAAAALSLCVGGFAALMQTNIKRLLAYSTINHVGFLLLSILTGGENGIAALLVYLAVYIVISLGTFAAILLLQQQGEAAEELNDLAGLGKRRPRMAMCMAILMFAAAGIPPTAGFLGKMFVLLAAMKSGFIWLAVLGVLTSVVATFYYLRVIKLMYFDDAIAPMMGVHKLSRRLVALLVITTGLTVGLMLMPGIVVDPAVSAAKTFMADLAR
ncbi:MAG TPA: NADH-quinone oxidoreductase subunit N, partial [Alphaproteobacteria bacterium]|nr:NADH-quinone oxidoreductase subunit N [Alphaproteobacteria bacterium]